MQTLTLQVSDARIMRSLKNILTAIDGVQVLRQSHAKQVENVPNETTKRAIEAARRGETYKASSTEDLFKQILG